MVGTFYRSPAPNEPVFIEKNDIVQKKQTVCIIEAMKLMNEIEAEISGEIVEILVNDGDIVDCGQALMKLKIS
uniref:Biotin carboxyl carrier protein of acetyl-CoA carboxylase n=1 Tax=Polyneura bonnemaisonii TaxID=136797 RepID=A0A4D6X2X9_9FLOR|nr:acetyl-CoA carboxylase, biotin carboxyl carrier protein [Polyneura bonnemaisonii]